MTMTISKQGIVPSMALRTKLRFYSSIVLLFLLRGSLGLYFRFAGQLQDFVGEVLSGLFGRT